MACATFKRPFLCDPMYCGQDRPSKRAKYSFKQSVSPTMEMSLAPSKLSPQKHQSPFGEPRNKMTPEKMAASIMEEAERLGHRKRLSFSCEGKENALTTASTDDKPLFTYADVGLICERMLKEQKEKIRAEYNQILNDKLAEQYDTFVKFTHDQIQKKFETHPSYLS